MRYQKSKGTAWWLCALPHHHPSVAAFLVPQYGLAFALFVRGCTRAWRGKQWTGDVRVQDWKLAPTIYKYAYVPSFMHVWINPRIMHAMHILSKWVHAHTEGMLTCIPHLPAPMSKESRALVMRSRTRRDGMPGLVNLHYAVTEGVPTLHTNPPLWTWSRNAPLLRLPRQFVASILYLRCKRLCQR